MAWSFSFQLEAFSFGLHGLSLKSPGEFTAWYCRLVLPLGISAFKSAKGSNQLAKSAFFKCGKCKISFVYSVSIGLKMLPFVKLQNLICVFTFNLGFEPCLGGAGLNLFLRKCAVSKSHLCTHFRFLANSRRLLTPF